MRSIQKNSSQNTAMAVCHTILAVIFFIVACIIVAKVNDTINRSNKNEGGLEQMNGNAITMSTDKSDIEKHSIDSGLKQLSVELKEDEEEPAIEIAYPFSDEDIIIVAKTLYGEAGCVKSKAEQAMVVWVILNRYDTGLFGKTLSEICTKPMQFTGYRASNPIDDACLELVYDVIDRWQAEKSGLTNVGRTIPAEFLYFLADSDPSIGSWHNKFYTFTYKTYGDKIYYDRNNPIENPYD